MALRELDSVWDVFISHAGEDKELFVRPLASFLAGLGVKVWYDEIELKIGYSLSRSIDKGLSLSRHGIVVLSEAFFEKAKGWPEYELRGLTSKEVGRAEVILPIWYGVQREDVLAFSPTLADKVAVNTEGKSIPQVAIEVLEVARPDIHEAVIRRLEYLRLKRSAPVETIPVADLKPNPRRRENLPVGQAVRVELVHTALRDVIGLSVSDLKDSFLRDLVSEDEIQIWERIATAYLKYVAQGDLDEEARKQVFGTLLAISMSSLNLEEMSRRDVALMQLYRSAGTGRQA